MSYKALEGWNLNFFSSYLYLHTDTIAIILMDYLVAMMTLKSIEEFNNKKKKNKNWFSRLSSEQFVPASILFFVLCVYITPRYVSV